MFAGVELMVAGGESVRCARELDYHWGLFLRGQRVRQNVSFSFGQCGTNCIKDGKQYRLQIKDLCSLA